MRARSAPSLLASKRFSRTKLRWLSFSMGWKRIASRSSVCGKVAALQSSCKVQIHHGAKTLAAFAAVAGVVPSDLRVMKQTQVARQHRPAQEFNLRTRVASAPSWTISTNSVLHSGSTSGATHGARSA
jgi:hypothetical protein